MTLSEVSGHVRHLKNSIPPRESGLPSPLIDRHRSKGIHPAEPAPHQDFRERNPTGDNTGPQGEVIIKAPDPIPDMEPVPLNINPSQDILIPTA